MSSSRRVLCTAVGFVRCAVGTERATPPPTTGFVRRSAGDVMPFVGRPFGGGIKRSARRSVSFGGDRLGAIIIILYTTRTAISFGRHFPRATCDRSVTRSLRPISETKRVRKCGRRDLWSVRLGVHIARLANTAQKATFSERFLMPTSNAPDQSRHRFREFFRKPRWTVIVDSHWLDTNRFLLRGRFSETNQRQFANHYRGS